MDADIIVSIAFIKSNNRVVRTIGNINSVFINGICTDIIFNQNIVSKCSENTSLGIVITMTASDNAIVRKHDSDAIPRAAHIIDYEPINDDIVSILNINSVISDGPTYIDQNLIAQCHENNR